MSRILIIFILFSLCTTASAQTARHQFDPAAKEYIHGNTPVASNLVEQALIKFPDNEPLLKLKKLIEQQQKQKDQQQQQNQQNQDQQDQQDPQDQNDPQDQDQDQNEEEDPQDQNEPEDQEPEDPKEQQPAPQPQQAGEMSKEEAQQLLDAMKQNEKDQRSDLRPYLGQPVRVDKDW